MPEPEILRTGYERKPLPRVGDTVGWMVVRLVVRSERHETVWVMDNGDAYEEWELTEWL